MKIERPSASPIRNRIYEIIFESDTRSGKLFDIGLIIAILVSVITVMLESVSSVRINYGRELQQAEWFFTILFSIEYVLRNFCVKRARSYLFSFFGIIDFLAIIPTYLSIVIPGTQFLLAIRILRILRIFRVLKLMRFLSQANMLIAALRASRYKIFVFLFTVLTLVCMSIYCLSVCVSL